MVGQALSSGGTMAQGLGGAATIACSFTLQCQPAAASNLQSEVVMPEADPAWA